MQDFSGGPVIKNLTSSAEHACSIPGRGTNIPHASRQQSPGTVTREVRALTREVHTLQWRPRMRLPPCKTKKVHEWKNNSHKLYLLSPEIVPTLAPSSFQPCFLPPSDNTFPSGFKGLLTCPFTVYEALIQHLSMSPSSALQIWPPLRNFPRPNFISHIFIFSLYKTPIMFTVCAIQFFN